MAVLEMQHICICALKKDRKKLLEFLQRQGVIEICEDIHEDNILHKIDVTAAKSLLAKNISTIKEANRLLEIFVPVKKQAFSSMQGRSIVSSAAYDEFYQKHDAILHKANRICALSRKIDELKAEIIRLEQQKEMLSPWISLDIPMNFTGTKYTAGFIGTLPYSCTQEAVYGRFGEDLPINLEIVSSTREQTCVFVLCPRENSEQVFEMLRGMGFSQVLSADSRAPAEQSVEIERKISEAHDSEIEAKGEIMNCAAFREELLFLEDFDSTRADKYEVLGNLLQTSNTFSITGYIPTREKETLEKALNSRFEVALEFEPASADEEVPVLLSNNSFSRPLEKTVESFSLPGKGEVDPTSVMSIFYYVLFGLMLSDAVYGAIMVFACAYCLRRFRNTLEDSMRDNLRMFFYCGITTIFWGVMFGSYFGDIVDVISLMFFGKQITIPPLWFFPVNEPMRMLVFSMLIGIIHLYTGLAMRLYQAVRIKDYKAVVYDTIFWYMLLTGCVFVLLSSKMFVDIVGLKFVLPSAVGNIAGITAGIAAVGIVATNGRESRNPFKRFLKGLYALYGITGYLSDVLSYSRLLALGLATGVICSVVNKMAGMTAGSAVGIVPFIFIIVLGNALNLGISALGAYVHTTRLQYVEFFGKFYQGGGRKFTPFNVKSKYFKFREE